MLFVLLTAHHRNFFYVEPVKKKSQKNAEALHEGGGLLN